MGKLAGKVALVTGAGRGFGRPIALAYAREGAKVAACALERDELEDLTQVIRSRGGWVLSLPVDLSREEDIIRVRDNVLQEFGRLDVLVNNAAVSFWKTMEETTIREWDYTLAVNLRAYFLTAKHFLDTMKKQGGGSIINITSRSAEEGFVAEIAYCPSKYAIEGLTQCMALELRQYNIAVNSLNVSSVSGKPLKPTGLTLSELERMPQAKQQYSDDDALVEAFSEAWTFLALQNGRGVTGQRFVTKELARFLKQNSWEAAVAKWKRKLTRAVYESYEFPRSVRYQTPGGGWKELRFD